MKWAVVEPCEATNVRNLSWWILNTTGVMKTVPSVYTLLVNTIYLCHSRQVTEGTFFRKHKVYMNMSPQFVPAKYNIELTEETV